MTTVAPPATAAHDLLEEIAVCEEAMRSARTPELARAVMAEFTRLLESRYELWIRYFFPNHVVHDLAEHHHSLWRWVWSIEDGRRVEPRVDIWSRGGAKALAVDTPIATPSGWTTMGALAPGDEVFDHLGRPTLVTATSGVEVRSAYRLDFRPDASIVASGDHRWTVLAQRALRACPPWADWASDEWEPSAKPCSVVGCTAYARRGALCSAHAERRRVGRPLDAPLAPRRQRGALRLAAETVTTDELASRRLRRGNEYLWAIPAAGSLVLPAADLPLDPYLLGVWLGDGNSSDARITVGAQDLDEMLALVSERCPVSVATDNGGASRVTLHGVYPALRALGLLGAKAVPDVYLRAGPAQRLDLLRGLLDTDGTVGSSGSSASFTSTRQPLADAVAELARSLGMTASVAAERAVLDGRDCGPTWRVRIGAATPEVFGLRRKADLLRSRAERAFAGSGTRHKIASIERVPDQPVQCITVASPTGLFLAGREMIPTHNSTTAELATASLGARRRRRYVLYVCHERGTEIRDPDLGWMLVEDHPTARERCDSGFRVRIAGLPFTETVTREHQYWVRRVARRDRGHGVPAQIMRTDPAWAEARTLDWNTWLGLPIDDVVEDRGPALTRNGCEVDHPGFDDPEWWWAIGLWWGDGTLGGGQRSQISWSTADAHPAIRERLIAVLRKYGYVPRVRPRTGCADVTICDASVARWLHEWKAGRNRKQPPEWVERLPLEKQASLLRGYLDADGHVDNRSVRLTSIHLPGLLSVRRMLARLGISSGITLRRSGRASTIQGRPVTVAPSYSLAFRENADRLGFEVPAHVESVRDLFIADGFLWSRVREIEPVESATFVPITTSTSEYETHFARSHNCGTQDQADEHVANLATLLESERFVLHYPDVARPHVGLHGGRRGWRRNRLSSASGFTVDAVGLDTAMRGVKVDADRPDLLVLDDVDDVADSALVTSKKVARVTRSLFPTGAEHYTILAIQNLVIPNGVMARIAGVARDVESGEILSTAHVCGPIPAVRDLQLEQRQDPPDPETGEAKIRWVITGGEPTWPAGQSLERCQNQIADWGKNAFLIEAQHEVHLRSGGFFKAFEWMSRVRPDGTPLMVQGPFASDDPDVIRIRAWDTAATEPSGDNDPDWTVGVLMAAHRTRKTYRIEDVVRFRAASGTVRTRIRQTTLEDWERYGNLRYWTGVEQEPGPHGRDRAYAWVHETLAGFNVKKLAPAGSKPERAAPFAGAMENMIVEIVERDWSGNLTWDRWVKDFLAEHEAFTENNTHDHDDQVDAAAHAFNWLQGQLIHGQPASTSVSQMTNARL